MKATKLALIFCILTAPLAAQSKLPVLKSNTKVLSIKDGDELMRDYWTIDPGLALDVYEAYKSNEIKTVCFYSDIDSISFELKPREQHDFLVVHGVDTCRTQIKSGIRFLRTPEMALEQDTIPFVLTTANNIIIQTILNKNDTLNLMFHTAQNTMSLTEEAVKKISDKGFDKSRRSQSWGGSHDSRYSVGNRISIQGFEWNNITIWEDKNTGPTADGKFGPNLFDNKVIELNFDESIMVIHSFMPELADNYKKTNLIFKQNGMYLETTYGIEKALYTNQVLLHSGYGGTILLDDAYVQKHKIGSKLEIISESQLKDSYGNILKTKKAILPYFAMGESSFRNMPVSFFEGVISNRSVSVMGGNLIKRFNIFLDLQQAEIHYCPNRLNGLPFEES